MLLHSANLGFPMIAVSSALLNTEQNHQKHEPPLREAHAIASHLAQAGL
jgi:hypothetical protein